MIAVRIPSEIRKYKEKLILNLTARQLLFSILAIAICVPLYLFGKDHINEEVLSWAVIIIALPLAGMGFLKVNGMPFERFMVVMIRQMFLFPSKRKFKSANFFRENQDAIIVEELGNIKGRKYRKYKEEAVLERTFLLFEAESQGRDVDYYELNNKLLTVRKPRGNDGNNKKNGKKKKENKKMANSKLKTQAEDIMRKQRDDPHYVPNKKDGQILLAYSNEVKKLRIADINKGKREMAKRNKDMKKRMKAKTFIPKSTQDTLPYIADYDEGLFEVEPNKFSKCFAINDINYSDVTEDEQVAIFCKWGEFLNYFSDDMNIAIYIDNKVVSLNEQEQKVFYQLKGDAYDVHRKEYNKILRKKIVDGNNDIQQNKYITVTIESESPYEAFLRFHKIEREVIFNLKKIGCEGFLMSTSERLSLLHDKFRRGREGNFKIDFDFLKKQGLSSKDYIAPSSFEFRSKDFFMIEDYYYKCMYLNNLPASLSDEFLHNLVDCDFPLTVSINVQPVAQDKALRLIKRQLTGMEANKIEAEKRAIRAGYSPETIHHDLQHSLAEAYELLDDMVNKNQKMFYVTVTVMVSGTSRNELDENCKIILSKARKYTCQFQNFDFQQEDGMRVTLPMGVTPNDKLFVDRALTTESTAIFMPFSHQAMFQPGGFYYGLHQVLRSLILCNRTEMKTPSGFIVGSSGSGKSFATKREILNVLLNDGKTGVLVIDPENEYSDFARAFHGTVLSLSASSDSHVNPMDMDENYGLDDGDDPETMPISRKIEKALQKKTDFLMSIIQCMISDGNYVTIITPQQKTIIDRCISKAYKAYFDSGFNKDFMPTLLNFQDELEKEKEFSEDARLLAEGVEYYTKGSMNMFSKLSNLDFSNRFVVFNIRDLGNELKQMSLLIMLDFVWNRMIENYQENVRTYCYVDEIHVLFQNDFSARYLRQLYKRGRKYGLVITGITQDVEDLLRSDMAKGMLSNSDFIMMLNQSSDNLEILSRTLKISEAQAAYVSRADAGSGLLFAEKTIVPFIDQFPTKSYLYNLMSTKFGENNTIDMSEYVANLIADQESKDSREAEA